MNHVHPITVLERIHHRRRAGRTANHRAVQRAKAQPPSLHVRQQHLPHRRHTCCHRHRLGLNQLVHRLAVQRPARKHQLGPHRRRRIRHRPRIRVKHRHHRHDAVARRHIQRIRQRRTIRMQHRRPVAVQHPLRVTSRPARVAQAAGRVLVQLRPVVHVRLRTQPRLVTQQPRHPAVGRQSRRVAQRHPMLHRRALRVHRLHQRQKRHVKQQHRILSVIHDPRQLLRVQPGVQRVQHIACPAHPKVQLQVPVTVPRQRCHPLAPRQPHAIQRIRHLLAALRNATPRCAVHIALHPARHHLRLRMVALGMGNQ